MCESVNITSDFEVDCEKIQLTLHCRNAGDAAKLFGVYLYHRCLLTSYEKGNCPKKISVNSVDMNVIFNAWYHKKEDGSVEIIVEAIYTKVVCTFYCSQSLYDHSRNLVCSKSKFFKGFATHEKCLRKIKQCLASSVRAITPWYNS